MSRSNRIFFLLIAVIQALSACATSPLGRRQLTLFSEVQMTQMGIAAFDQVKEKSPPSQDPRMNLYVRCVAQTVTETVRSSTGQTWEVLIFENDQANAFALPGRKIGIHTGMLSVADTPDQLAAVIAHEIAHVLARHANERASTKFAAQTGLDLVGVISGNPTPTKEMLLGVLGLGAQFGILLPYDRAQESEADLVGLDLMARAGFDPRASILLWQNMSRARGAQPPEFLSTHPSHRTRISDLQSRMPHAVQIYNEARSRGNQPRCAVP